MYIEFTEVTVGFKVSVHLKCQTSISCFLCQIQDLKVFFCTYRSPITRPIQELTIRKILEIKKTPNMLSPVFKIQGLPQQDHFKVKG